MLLSLWFVSHFELMLLKSLFVAVPPKVLVLLYFAPRDFKLGTNDKKQPVYNSPRHFGMLNCTCFMCNTLGGPC